jgi:hypothetical protein
MNTLFAQLYTPPTYFGPVVLSLLGVGAVVWFIAAVFGFLKSRVYGPSARWFAIAASCLVIYHLQLITIGYLVASRRDLVMSVGAFFNLFIVLAAIFAIIGFTKLTYLNKN